MSIKTFIRTHWKRWLVIFGIFLLMLTVVLAIFSRGPFDDIEGEPEWGITFSVPYAKELGVGWQETYLALLDDLGVDLIRIPAYWPDIEPEDDQFAFEELDWMIDEAGKRNARVLLVVGRRTPRWPECHVPGWAQVLPEDTLQKKILEMLPVVVERYRDNKTIVQWQVGNEPYVEFFGTCPEPDKAFIQASVDLVRELDPTREIVVTDSGELGSFWRAARHGDVLGSTMYKVVPRGDARFGYTKWYLPAWFYHKKANLARRLAPNLNGFIIAELQAEPWAGNTFIANLTPEEQDRSVDIEQFRENIAYARKANAEQVYLWGAEWWYWTWKAQGRPEFWEATRELWDN